MENPWLRVALLFLVGLSIVYLVPACGGSTTTTLASGTTPSATPTKTETPLGTASPTASPSPTPRPQGQIIEAGTSVPTVLNPLLETDPGSQRVMDNLFDTLLSVNAQSAVPGPSLASNWEMTTDNLTVTFHLRSDVLWHDGQPFTSQDVLFTFNSILSPTLKSPLKARLIAADEFYAPDEKSVVVSFKRPGCPALYDIGQIPILPRHLLQGQDPQSATFTTDHPIGTGPFRFKQRLPDGSVEMERNERYFAGPPHFTEWVYRPMSDTLQITQAVQAGEVDLATVALEEVSTVEKRDKARIITFSQPEYFLITLNNAHPILGDVKVRQALAYAVDRQQLVKDLLAGQGKVIDASLLPGHWAYSAASVTYGYDPDKARLLLRDAGWADSDQDGLLDKSGKPLQIGLCVNGENALRKGIALAVQRYWLAIGVSAEVQFAEFSTLVERLFTHRFDAAVFSWPIHPDPDQTRLWASDQSALNVGFNFVSYANSDVDKALADGLAAGRCNMITRAAACRQVISTLSAEQPYIFLFVPHGFVAASRRLSGLQPGPYSNLSWNISQWQVEQK